MRKSQQKRDNRRQYLEGFRDLGRRTRKKERQNDTGPAAQKGAIAAAKARKHVAIVDRTVVIGGVSFHTVRSTQNDS